MRTRRPTKELLTILRANVPRLRHEDGRLVSRPLHRARVLALAYAWQWAAAAGIDFRWVPSDGAGEWRVNAYFHESPAGYLDCNEFNDERPTAETGLWTESELAIQMMDSHSCVDFDFVTILPAD